MGISRDIVLVSGNFQWVHHGRGVGKKISQTDGWLVCIPTLDFVTPPQIWPLQL